jgi:uncharacterized protein YndB with AHSA1/START domain
MPTGAHAVLQDHDGEHALVFERMLAHPPERVWRALVTPDGLADWHPTPFELDPGSPEPGARIRYIRTEGAPEMPEGELLEYDPPRLLAHSWGEDRLRWELRAHDGGTALRLTHTFADRFKAARDGAGWHLCLQALSDSLEQLPRPRHGNEPRLPDDWSGLNQEYQRRFGIAPEQATPPPQL